MTKTLIALSLLALTTCAKALYIPEYNVGLRATGDSVPSISAKSDQLQGYAIAASDIGTVEVPESNLDETRYALAKREVLSTKLELLQHLFDIIAAHIEGKAEVLKEIKELISSLATAKAEAVEGIIESLISLVEGLKDAKNAVLNHVIDKFESVLKFIHSTFHGGSHKAERIVNTVIASRDISSDKSDVISTKLDILKNLFDVIAAHVEGKAEVLKEIKELLASLWSFKSEAIGSKIDKLISLVDGLKDAKVALLNISIDHFKSILQFIKGIL